MPRTFSQLEPRSADGAVDDPLRKPALQSLALHGSVVGALLGYGLIMTHLHGNTWGNNSQTEGAIQATMVSSAPAIPLPKEEEKPTDSVLATQTPSPAPAPPAPIQLPAEEIHSIPIPVKQPDKVRLEPKKSQQQPIKQPVKQVSMVDTRHSAPERPTNRAVYGESAPVTPRSMAQATPASQVNVQGGDFGARFPWYVDAIRRRTEPLIDRTVVDPSTRVGARSYVNFVISRDGSPHSASVSQSSGSPSLDSACLRAIQRVDTYGPLPPAYSGSSLSVSYYCEQTSR
jgi:protein TonB